MKKFGGAETAMILPRLALPSTADGPGPGGQIPTPDASPVLQSSEFTLPEGIHRSREAFFRDLPELIKCRDLRGKWVAYHRDERVGVAVDDEPLIRECIRRGLKADEYIVDVIEPKPTEPE
jgi:hypothetical protein